MAGRRLLDRQFVLHVGLFAIIYFKSLALPQDDNCILSCHKGKSLTAEKEDTYKCRLNISQKCGKINELLEKNYFRTLSNRKLLEQIKGLDLSCTPSEASPVVNLTEIHNMMPRIHTLAITGCKISKLGLEGTLPWTVQTLNLSYNALESLPDSMFQYSPDSSVGRLGTVDLRGNVNLTSLPPSLLRLKTLERIWLGSHSLRCNWTIEHLYPLYTENPHIFQDGSVVDCISAINNQNLSLTVQGALKAKDAETKECKRTPHCSCRIFVLYRKKNQIDNVPVSFTDRGENISIILNVDCSSKNLTQLPDISPHTKVLNVSDNQIRRLDKLDKKEYRNLRTLVAEKNLIEDIQSIKGTEFAKHFDVLNLAHNRITSHPSPIGVMINPIRIPVTPNLPEDVMRSLLNSEVKGHGKISLEENEVVCTCESVKVKLLLTQFRDKVTGVKSISCLQLGKKLHELQTEDVCEIEEEDSSGAEWWIIITVEVCLILIVLTKVYYDSRQYRQTGILPWCSDMMPRLPCDFMLEGIKGHRVER